MKRLVIAREASRDLEGIVDYFLSRNNVEAGERFVQGFDRKCRNIAQFPMIGRSYAEIVPGLRGVPLEKHIILYEVTAERIAVIRVVSGYQDLRALFEEEGDEE